MQVWPDGCYKARWILPISKPAIEGGMLRIVNGCVAELASDSSGSIAIDLGDSIVLPGLVNAHTHLEFSDLQQPIGTQGMRLPEWISMVVRRRIAASKDGLDVNQSIMLGLRESRQAGVALIGEIATMHPGNDQSLSRVAEHSPEVFSFTEVLGLSEDRQNACLNWAEATVASNVGPSNVGLSPHSPYSVPLPFLDRCMALSVRQQRTVAMHLAESPEELELLNHGSGGFREALEAIGVWREGLFPIEGGIDAYLRGIANAPRGLVVHGNYLSGSQIDFLSGQRHLSVVYCPRTHSYFDHDPHPVTTLREHGIRVALGTDSRASNPDLSMWNEAIWLRGHRPDLSPAAILEMITLAGAEAIGKDEYGKIEVGVPAKFNLIRGTDSSLNSAQVMESLFDHSLAAGDRFFEPLIPVE